MLTLKALGTQRGGRLALDFAALKRALNVELMVVAEREMIPDDSSLLIAGTLILFPFSTSSSHVTCALTLITTSCFLVAITASWLQLLDLNSCLS